MRLVRRVSDPDRSAAFLSAIPELRRGCDGASTASLSTHLEILARIWKASRTSFRRVLPIHTAAEPRAGANECLRCGRRTPLGSPHIRSCPGRHSILAHSSLSLVVRRLLVPVARLRGMAY